MPDQSISAKSRDEVVEGQTAGATLLNGGAIIGLLVLNGDWVEQLYVEPLGRVRGWAPVSSVSPRNDSRRV